MSSNKNAENRARAVELHFKGWTLGAIGKDLGVCAKTVSHYLRTEFVSMARREGDLDQQRAKELVYLNQHRAKLVLLLDAHSGTKALTTLIKELRALSKEIRLLMGLDAPTKVKIFPETAPWLDQDAQRKQIKADAEHDDLDRPGDQAQPGAVGAGPPP